jgi:hypothetical protein
MHLPRRRALVDPPEYENTSSDVELRSSARAAFEKRSAQADKSGPVFAHYRYHCGSDLIILDEPTNNLGVDETKGVLRFVRSARDSGHSCIFIAHNIYHVFQVVDRIVVLRRGKKVADDIDPKQTTIEAVESIITGMTIIPP